jgi:hypothetical protein
VNTKKHGAYSRDDIGCDNRTLIFHLISSYEKLLISNLHLQRKVTALSGRVEEISLKLSQMNDHFIYLVCQNIIIVKRHDVGRSLRCFQYFFMNYQSLFFELSALS